RRIRRVRVLLGEGRGGWTECSVNLVSRDVMESPRSSRPILRPHRARRFEQFVSSPDIRVDEWIRTVDRSVDVRFRGEVHDRIDTLALENVAHQVAIANVALHEAESLVLRHRFEARQVAGVGEGIEADDLVGRMMLRPELDEIAADESGGSCYKDLTHRGYIPHSLI